MLLLSERGHNGKGAKLTTKQDVRKLLQNVLKERKRKRKTFKASQTVSRPVSSAQCHEESVKDTNDQTA